MRLALLTSGGDGLVDTVIHSVQAGELSGVKSVVLLTDRCETRDVATARLTGVQPIVVNRAALDHTHFRDQLFAALVGGKPDLVVQLGWTSETPREVIQAFPDKIISHYPGSLDPAHGGVDFGGEGMFGARVTAAVIAYHQLLGHEICFTESTLHHVSGEEDNRGGIVSAAPVFLPLRSNWQSLVDRSNVIQNRALAAEFRAGVKAAIDTLLIKERSHILAVLATIASGKSMPRHLRDQPLIPEANYAILAQAKAIAEAAFPRG